MAFWAFAALAVLWEWDTLVCADDRNPVLATGALTLPARRLVAWTARHRGRTDRARLLRRCRARSKVRRVWCAVGLVYAAAS